MLGAEKALGVDLADVFGTGRASGEPPVLGRQLHAAERGAIPWGPVEHLEDWLARQLAGA